MARVYRVILVRTQGARNAGLAARAVANFGPAELYFAAPVDPSLFQTCEFYEMAHGVKNSRTRFPIVATLDEALADCTDSYGFTARMRRHRGMRDLSELAVELETRPPSDGERIALVFGNEIDGMTTEETASIRHLVHIRTSREQPSINLGACVSIVLSRLYRGEGAKRASKKHRPLAAAKTDMLIAHLKPALLRLVRGEAATKDLDASIDRVFRTAQLETRDARAWHRLARLVLGETATDGDDTNG